MNFSVFPYTTTNLGWIIIEVALILKTSQLVNKVLYLIGPESSLACPQEKIGRGQESRYFYLF